MDFSLEQRTARLGVGEFASFTLGPHDSGAGTSGVWRAQLGTYWHQQLRAQAAGEHAGAEFEVAIEGRIFHRGWTLTFTGRIDQLLADGPVAVLREIKTVMRPLPADENELRAAYPEYFVQLATYAALWRLRPPPATPASRAELVFVEAGSGLAQTIALTPADDGLFRSQLERITEFLDLRWRARDRLRHLNFLPAFAALRPGQETTAADLRATVEGQQGAIFFEAPTGFGKTGVLLECALGQLRSGHFERVLYLTSKSTGQIQVMRTLAGMTIPDKKAPLASTTTQVAAWHVRNKSEHCVNDVFHCVRDQCRFLDGAETRWPQSGLSRFYLFENEPRDLPSLRAAGRAAVICPYEITRAALAFNDVWIGDYNYVFAPRNRTLFYEQPGFDPARTLLLLDEAHNLPSRVADAFSHAARSDEARSVLAELDHLGAAAPLVRAWESWAQLLGALQPVDSLDPALEADVAATLAQISEQLTSLPLDYAALGPRLAEIVWQAPQLAEWLGNVQLKKLLWSPRPGELNFTCIDAAEAIGETLGAYGGVVFASATLSPVEVFAASCGLNVPPNTPRPLGTPLFRGEPAMLSGSPLERGVARSAGVCQVTAHTPWRAGAYDVAVDARVDTSFQQRTKFHTTTAATVEALHTAAQRPSIDSSKHAIAVFFPSYAYAEAIQRALDQAGSVLRVALQPRLPDLAAQTAWVEESLALTDALFLVLGSSFAESIDLLGGRVTHAMVVGPALPEVNAVQRARLAEFSALGRAEAFRRVYQIPGMTKVNQALGRLVRAPGQRARVLLHCRRFLEPSYAALLAQDYQFGANLLEDADLSAWLARPA